MDSPRTDPGTSRNDGFRHDEKHDAGDEPQTPRRTHNPVREQLTDTTARIKSDS